MMDQMSVYDSILDRFFNEQDKETASGNRRSISFDCSVSKSQGRYLYDLVLSSASSNCLEIGLAWGGSAVHILAALQELKSGNHTAIDPYQLSMWDGVAISEINRIGIGERFSFLEGRSDLILPQFVREGRTFDFIFVDGDHRFDGAFVDWHYCQQLLSDDGLLIFDDCQSFPLKVITAFIRSNFANMHFEGNHHGRFSTFRKTGPDARREGDNFPFCKPIDFEQEV